MYLSKQQLYLPGFYKFSWKQNQHITDENILKTRVVGLRGGKKLPPILFPLSDFHVEPSKKEAVQLNKRTAEFRDEKVSSKVKKLRLDRPKKMSSHPYRARINISSI